MRRPGHAHHRRVKFVRCRRLCGHRSVGQASKCMRLEWPRLILSADNIACTCTATARQQRCIQLPGSPCHPGGSATGCSGQRDVAEESRACCPPPENINGLWRILCCTLQASRIWQWTARFSSMQCTMASGVLSIRLRSLRSNALDRGVCPPNGQGHVRLVRVMMRA